MNAISVNVRNARSLSGDENSAGPSERPSADSPSPVFSHTFKRQPSLEILGMNDRCWDRLFDQLIARVDAIVAARHAREHSPIPHNCAPQSGPGNLGNRNDPASQLKEVLDALAESPAAPDLGASRGFDEPEWSDSDTAREMQRNRGSGDQAIERSGDRVIR